MGQQFKNDWTSMFCFKRQNNITDLEGSYIVPFSALLQAVTGLGSALKFCIIQLTLIFNLFIYTHMK